MRRRSKRGPLIGYLYRLDRALPKRRMTPAMWTAVRAAVRARKVCDKCGVALPYIPPRYTGYRCWDCVGVTG
jgi:hypothetical protein